MISLFFIIVRYGFYIVTGFDLYVCLDWSSVDISICSKSISINFMLSSKQSWSKIFLNLILGRLSTTLKATINIWILRAVCMPKMRATTSIRIPLVVNLNLGIEVLKIVIHFRDDAGSLRMVIKDVLVYHTVPGGIAVSIDGWSLAMEDVTDYREFCKGRGILMNDSSMRSSIIFDTVLFELHESDAHILLQIVKTLHRDILTEWSLKRGHYKRADTLIRLLRTNRLYRDGHGPGHQVAVSINTFKSTTTIDSGRVRKVNLITGPVKLQLLHSADSQALFSTGSVAINLTCADSLQETCILRVDRTIGCRNKTVEGYLELFKSAHYPAVVFISARCVKALLVRIPVAILLGGEQRDQKEHYNLAIRKLLCSCLTKLYRLRLDLSKISLCFDDFNDERNAVVNLTTLHFDVCQDSTNEESMSLASILEIDKLLLKNSSGSVVFSSADNSASWAVMASSQEIDFIPRNLEMSAIHLISERFSMHLGLLSFFNAKEGLGRLLLRSLSCVTSHSKRGKIGSILFSCGYADGSSRRMGSMILRNFQATGAIESISLEVGVGKVEMSMYLPQNRIVRTVFGILNLTPPLKRPRRPLSIALSAQLTPNQKVFPAYFPLISDREHVLDPIRAASVLLHQTGRVADVILKVVLPNHATFILELSSIVLERYSHHRNVPLAMQSFWLVEVHRFRASTCRHSFTISARQPFLNAKPQEGAIDTVVIRISLAWYTDSYAVVASSKIYASPMGAFHLLLVNNDDLSVLHSLISELFVVSPGKSNDRYASDILNLIDTRVVILPFTLHVNEGLISLSFCRQMMRSTDDIASWLAKALIERIIVSIQKLPFIHPIKR